MHAMNTKYIHLIVVIVLLSCFTTASAQTIVVHNDLYQRVSENTLNKTAQLTLYNTKMDSVKSNRNKVLENWTTIEVVQKKIYNNLTNVDDGIKNSKQLYYVGQRIPKIFSNVLEASKMAAGKPYLMTYWNSTGQILIDKALDLQNFLTQFVLSHDNDSLLIDQTTRDEMVWTAYNKINTIYNISGNMVSLFRMYTLQMAINKVVPYEWYINLDKSISTELINSIKNW